MLLIWIELRVIPWIFEFKLNLFFFFKFSPFFGTICAKNMSYCTVTMFGIWKWDLILLIDRSIAPSNFLCHIPLHCEASSWLKLCESNYPTCLSHPPKYPNPDSPWCRFQHIWFASRPSVDVMIHIRRRARPTRHFVHRLRWPRGPFDRCVGGHCIAIYAFNYYCQLGDSDTKQSCSVWHVANYYCFRTKFASWNVHFLQCDAFPCIFTCRSIPLRVNRLYGIKLRMVLLKFIIFIEIWNIYCWNLRFSKEKNNRNQNKRDETALHKLDLIINHVMGNWLFKFWKNNQHRCAVNTCLAARSERSDGADDGMCVVYSTARNFRTQKLKKKTKFRQTKFLFFPLHCLSEKDWRLNESNHRSNHIQLLEVTP